MSDEAVEDHPFMQFYEMYTSVFQRIVRKAVLSTFVKSFRDYYIIDGISEMGDKTIIRFRKRTGYERED